MEQAREPSVVAPMMVAPLAYLAALAAASPFTSATPAAAPIGAAVHAAQLFERDWVLMQWALKRHDSDRDSILSAGEAVAASDEFRRIADGDGDGRVSQSEFRAAREFILARY